VPAVKVKLLDIVRFAPSSNVNVEVLKEIVVQIAPDAVVHVPVPDAESKITASAATGAEAPPAPPDVADQFVVVTASQVPEPPTQYLFAIFTPRQSTQTNKPLAL
jgi:hypothetical protein